MFYAIDATVAERNKITKVRPSGFTTGRRPYFGPPPSSAIGDSPDTYIDPEPGEVREPQAFIVEQGAGTELGAHFHYVDQFQLVVRGDGFIGRHHVKPFSLHFAGASTGYGPIKAGEDDGLHYLTLRACCDGTGAQYLPQSKHRLRATPKRNLMLEQMSTGELTSIPLSGNPLMEILAQEPDGLAVVLITMPSGTLASPALPHAGAGQSLVVLSGAVTCRGNELARLGVMFASDEDLPVQFQAGSEGAHVLLLQFPRFAISQKQ